MNSEKILTVSIAAYNVEKYIKRTLDSLITDENTMSKTEVIVVNDGSTDGTAKIAEEYVNKYPDTFKLISKENGGYGSTVNTTIAVARGKYYKLLDGDDRFTTEHLAGFIDYLEKCDSDLVLAPFTEDNIADNKEVLVSTNDCISEETNDIEKIEIPDNPAMHEMAVRTRVLSDNNVRIKEKCFYTDTDFIIKTLIYSKTVSRYDKSIYCYNVGREGQSISKEGLKKHYIDAIDVSMVGCDDVSKVLDELNDGVKKKLLIKRLNRMVSLAYTVILLQDNKIDVINELKRYDKSLKIGYPQIYELTGIVKRIKLMRKTGFKMVGLYRKILKI